VPITATNTTLSLSKGPGKFAAIPTTIDPPYSAPSPVVPALMGPGRHLPGRLECKLCKERPERLWIDKWKD
jgi:hypothetical protein